MSAIRSALDEIASVDNADLSVHELDCDIEELLEAQTRIEVHLAEKASELARRNGHRVLEYPSPTAYLMHRGNLSAGRARRIVADAHATEKAPATFRAWADGRLSTDQARRVFAMAEAVPDQFTEAEETLVDIVEGLSVSDTHRAVEYWRQSVEDPNQLTVEAQQDRRGLSVSKSWDGMRRVDGWLTDAAGEAFETVLDALMSPPIEDDSRTPRQRRHDALEDLARDYLDRGDTPQVGGEKPHVMVLTDLDALKGMAGGVHETLNGADILDIGRKTRVWTTGQRRAIAARDRHCQAPGCERPPRWCDIHHLDHWADGGPTDIDKGKLFCRFHHVLEHIKQAKHRRMKTQG